MKLDVETDENMAKTNENHRKVVACVDFVAPIFQILNISNIGFTCETDQLHNHR